MNLSLGEFVKYLVLLMQKNDVKFSFRTFEPWHLLFYRLKNMPEVEGKPEFFENLRFNWDGRYPKSPELSEFLSVLCWTGSIITDDPEYKEYRLHERIERLWSQQFETVENEEKQFLNTALLLAREEFQEFKSSIVT